MNGLPLIMILFAVYAMIGWCLEVIYATIDDGKFVNRGFLNGPVCPIYGCGAVLVVGLLQPVNSNVFILFLASVALTTLLELVTGWILERVFGQKWWDYSDEHFQFKGYICLKFSLLWGLACVLLVRVIHSLILKLVNLLPEPVHVVLLISFYAIFILDLILTVTSLIKLQKSYRILNKMDELLNRLSEEIGEKLYEGTVKGMTGLEESKEHFTGKRVELAKEFEELSAKYRERFHERNLIHKRIRKAFPKLSLPSLKEKIESFEQRYSAKKESNDSTRMQDKK